MSLHIWAISHGVATLFAQGEARKVPMSAEDILESAMLIYLERTRHSADGKAPSART